MGQIILWYLLQAKKRNEVKRSAGQIVSNVRAVVFLTPCSHCSRCSGDVKIDQIKKENSVLLPLLSLSGLC